jgi:hypothetical protein
MQFYAGSRTDEMDENIEDLFIGVGYFTLNGPKIIQEVKQQAPRIDGRQ